MHHREEPAAHPLEVRPRDDGLEEARRAQAERRWDDAYRLLSSADQSSRLDAADLEKLALCAYLIGRETDYLATLDRAHRAHLEAGDVLRATRCAFWLGLRLMFRGEMGPATGWLARARRLIEGQPEECVEHGYLLLPVVQRQLIAGSVDEAFATAARAVEIGNRFSEPDLSACARHLQGLALLEKGQLQDGLALLDEAMVAVTGGELSPIVTGLIYCSVIDGCQQVYALARAREWTEALAHWCDEQPELVAFTGVCRVHRAEIMQVTGDWQDALEEAQRAADRCLQVHNLQSAAAAFYRLGEVHRLRGDFGDAEEAYRQACERGYEPQPGLALMRLAQGRLDLAAAAIRRIVNTTTGASARMRLLPAHVEIMLAAGDREAAREACDELEETAGRFKVDGGTLAALAAQARGAVELAEGNPAAGLVSLRRAWQLWQQLRAPHAGAGARVLIGLACRALTDEDGSRMEFEAALGAFDRLGARPDVTRVTTLLQTRPRGRGGLSARELEVLRLAAAGKTNKHIAAELCLSEKTIDRHMSNILGKLEVASRAAATAYAYEHHLI